MAADDPRFEALASETGGNFYELTRSTDFSGMIDEIGGDIAKQYRLTYKSPRSSYDGTTRDIAITVGGKTGEQAFLEPHLINIQSSLPIFLCLLAVLLLALAVPAWFGRRPAEPAAEVKPRHVPPVPAQAAAGAAAQGARAQAPAPAVAAAEGPVCPTCGPMTLTIFAQGRLRVLSGPRSGLEVDVLDAVTLGSYDGCALYLPGDKAIARKHACVYRQERRFFVTDLDSPSGTKVNGAQLAPGASTSIEKGAKIQLGQAVVELM